MITTHGGGGGLWAFNIDEWNPTEQEWEEACSFLDEVERDRVDKFKFPIGDGKYCIGRHNASAKSTLAGRLLILALMVRELNFNHCKEAKLDRTPKSKPFLQNAPRPEFNFNVSHSGAWVVMAWDWHRLVGIDVMKVEVRGRDKRVDYFLKDFESCFTIHEWDIIQNHNNTHNHNTDTTHTTLSSMLHQGGDTARLHRFYWHWTLKESYIKAVGIGLGFTLERADFFIDPIQSTIDGGSVEKESVEKGGVEKGGVEKESVEEKRAEESVEKGGVEKRSVEKESVEEGSVEEEGGVRKRGKKRIKKVATAKVAIDSQLMREWRFDICYLDREHVVTIGYGPQEHAEKSWKKRTLLQQQQQHQQPQPAIVDEQIGRVPLDEEQAERLVWEIWDFTALLSVLQQH